MEEVFDIGNVVKVTSGRRTLRVMGQDTSPTAQPFHFAYPLAQSYLLVNTTISRRAPVPTPRCVDWRPTPFRRSAAAVPSGASILCRGPLRRATAAMLRGGVSCQPPNQL